MFRNVSKSATVLAIRAGLRQQAAGTAAGALVALLIGAPAIAATPPSTFIAAEDCDPIVIPQPAAKKVTKKPVAKKPALSTPAKPLPKPVAADGAAVAQAKPKPRPKPKPKVATVAAKPMVIADACPGAGSNPDDLAGLPTNLKDLIEPGSGQAALASVFPASGNAQSAALSSLTSLAPAERRSSGPGNFGPTVPMMPGGGTGGGGGGGSDETTPINNPPSNPTPPPGDNPPPGGNPPPSPPPPVKVPEPGTLGVLLGGLVGMALLRRRSRR